MAVSRPVQAAVGPLFADRLERAEGSPVAKDPKTALQEHLQGRRLALPRYSVLKTEGEAHDQTFIVECRVDELGAVAEGRGMSRRAAEQSAAEAVLAQLESAGERGSRRKRP
jgi:ribonuclease-3